MFKVSENILVEKSADNWNQGWGMDWENNKMCNENFQTFGIAVSVCFLGY